MVSAQFLALQQRLQAKRRSPSAKKAPPVQPRFILANYVAPSLVRTHMPACNASLFRWEGRLMLLAREANYTFRQDGTKHIAGWPVVHGWPSKQHCYTNEVLYDFESTTNEARHVGYLSYVPEEDRHRLNYIGYEDVRLMDWGDGPVASFTVVDNDHNFTMAYAKVGSGLTLGEVVKVPTENAVEKNWQPIEGMPHQYIYSLKPYCLIDTLSHKRHSMGEGAALKLRGSSPVIVHRGMRICIAHVNNWPTCKTYVHVFVLFDEAMNIVKVTEPFAFFGAPIEFNTSLFSNGDSLEVLFSVHDQLLYRITLGPALLGGILEGTLDNRAPIPQLYEKLYRDALENHNVKAAVGLATFASSRGVREHAAGLVHGLRDVSQDNKDLIVKQLVQAT